MFWLVDFVVNCDSMPALDFNKFGHVPCFVRHNVLLLFLLCSILEVTKLISTDSERWTKHGRR